MEVKILIKDLWKFVLTNLKDSITSLLIKALKGYRIL